MSLRESEERQRALIGGKAGLMRSALSIHDPKAFAYRDSPWNVIYHDVPSVWDPYRKLMQKLLGGNNGSS